MEERTTELEQALKTIREECRKHTDNNCSACVLGNADGLCMIKKTIPEKWVLRSDNSNEPIRLFI